MIRIFRQWIMDTLGFSRSEANGTLVLIIILLIAIVIPRLFLFSTEKVGKKFNPDQDKLDQWSKQLEQALIVKQTTSASKPAMVKKRFPFDPNLATKEELVSLGFTSLTAHNMVRYREKGGRFKVKDDLKKIYGISQKQLSEVWTLIQLPNQLTTAKPEVQAPKTEKTIKEKTIKENFDLNDVDAQTLRTIRGIGPILSDRIIKFRDRLGGFYATSQLYEVYGLDSLVVQKIINSSSIQVESIRQININSDSMKTLYRHPYISYNMAKAIYNYRLQRGQLDSITQIKSIKILSDSIYQKIYPYLSLHP